ncbi:MAG: NAD(P)/FAD-dependent oxidoreductase [Bdellovibrionales bacterium]
MKKKVVVIGGGFAGLTVTQSLSGDKNFDVTLIDRRNHHLFQPLLYQVAMAGLNPSEISVPLRRLFSKSKNVTTLMAEIEILDLKSNRLMVDEDWLEYDYLVMACGSKHFYFGKDHWEEFAPGLKTIEQATEIRRRVLLAFEYAEKESDSQKKQELLTFVVVGGGPTGVELAGSIAEMAHTTLKKDFKNVDLSKTKVLLIESGSRVLNAFHEDLSASAKKDLEELGVEVILGKLASNLTADGLNVGDEFIKSHTIIWAAGVKPAKITKKLESKTLEDGRVLVGSDLSLEGIENVFVLGDQAASFDESKKEYLPGLAPVAIQQGKYIGNLLKREIKGQERKVFKYLDKGIMATIGRSKAVVETGGFKFTGFFAWSIWVVIHVAYLVQFKNRFFVLLQWMWGYFSFGRGARLIVHKSWKFYSGEKIPISSDQGPRE